MSPSQLACSLPGTAFLPIDVVLVLKEHEERERTYFLKYGSTGDNFVWAEVQIGPLYVTHLF